MDAVTRAGVLAISVKDSLYEQASYLLLEGTPASIQQAAEFFAELGEFRDSLQRLEECRNKIAAFATTPPMTEGQPVKTPDSGGVGIHSRL